MKPFTQHFVVVVIVISLIHFVNCAPLESEVEDGDAKGLLDGVTGGSSTTASPLGGLGGLGSAAGNAGPMLILGSFQAIVTKFDPALLPGILSGGGLPSLPPAGK